MLNFIVCEDNKEFMNKNVKSINNALIDSDLEYKIIKFTKYDDNLNNYINDYEDRKIFILDIQMDGISGVEIATRIREIDFHSIIIFATAYEKYQQDVFYSQLMVLDFIPKYTGYEERLKNDIVKAIEIINNKSTFCFQYNHVMYKLPYKCICFIEKEPFIKRCIIHTMNNKFYICKSINDLEKELEGKFVKTHQSCIMNFNNIRNYDYGKNIVTFKNDEISGLISKDKKKVVIEYVSGS